MNNNNLSSINEIVIPSLSDPQYASDLNAALHAIKDNFEVLANHSFIKGADGSSISITNMPTCDGEELTEIGQLVKDSIEANYSEDELESLSYSIDGVEHTITVFDNLYDENNYVCVIKNADESIASSMYYVFIDKRFANNNIGLLNVELFANIKDASCVMVYNSTTESFDVLRNAFPTIYYERGVGLCWKIHGNESQIPVQGVRGRDGQDAPLYIVKCTTRQNTQGSALFSAVVSEVFDGALGYVSVDNIDITECDGNSALILCPKSEGSAEFDFYFGSLTIRENALTAISDVGNGITTALGSEVFINAMKSISLIGANDTGGSSTIRGLFIPIENNEGDKQKVHLMSSTSITNNEGYAGDLNTDIILTPIDDINNINVDEDNKLVVEKYLYVKVNEIFYHLRDIIPNIIDTDFTDIINCLTSTNTILKYKLSSIVKNINALDFDFKNESNNASGIYCPYDKVCYKKCNHNPSTGEFQPTNELTKDPDDTMPYDFKNKLVSSPEDTDKPGLYRWDLDYSFDDFDIPELLNIQNNGLNDVIYNFHNAFKTIFTTTISPSSADEIMWFNALSCDPVYNENTPVYKHDFNDGVGDRFIIYGWQYFKAVNIDLFVFEKFIPVFVNDFAISNDTTLNVNYNVNITGDKNNHNKNLTVHGNINTNELNVDSINAKHINNIYTTDVIVGTGGLNIGENAEFNVDSNGKLTTEIINSNEILSKSLHASEKIILKREDSSENLFDVRYYNNDSYITVHGGNAFIEMYSDKLPTETNGIDKINSIEPALIYTQNRAFPNNNNTAINPYTSLNIYTPCIELNENFETAFTYDDVSYKYINSSNTDLIDICTDYKLLADSVYTSANKYSSHTAPALINYHAAEKKPVTASAQNIFTSVDREIFEISIPVKSTAHEESYLYGLKWNSGTNKFTKMDNLNEQACKLIVEIKETFGFFIGVNAKPDFKRGSLGNLKFTWPKLDADTSKLKVNYTVSYYDPDDNKTYISQTYNYMNRQIPSKTNAGDALHPIWTTPDFVGYDENGNKYSSEPNVMDERNTKMMRWELFLFKIDSISITGSVYESMLNRIIENAKNINGEIKISVSFELDVQMNTNAPSDASILDYTDTLKIQGINRVPYTMYPNVVVGNGLYNCSNWGDITVSTFAAPLNDYNKSYQVGSRSYYGYFDTDNDKTLLPKLGLYNSGLILTDQVNSLVSIALNETDKKYYLVYKDPALNETVEKIPIRDVISVMNTVASTSYMTYGV